MLKFFKTATQSEIPFEQVKGGRMLEGTIGLMVFLVTLCLGAVVIINTTLKNWSEDMKNGFTIELSQSLEPQQNLSLQTALMEALRRYPGIIEAEVISHSQRESILEPWRESATLEKSQLPPMLFDVRTDPRVQININKVMAELEPIFPTIKITPERQWRKNFISLLNAIEYAALGLASVIVLAAVLTIVFTTHTGLVIHERVIEILRLIGAQDKFIAKQFQQHAFKLALRGGILGVLISCLSYWGLSGQLIRMNATAFQTALDKIDLLGVVLLAPILIAIIVMFSARVTVLFSLARQ